MLFASVSGWSEDDDNEIDERFLTDLQNWSLMYLQHAEVSYFTSVFTYRSYGSLDILIYPLVQK